MTHDRSRANLWVQAAWLSSTSPPLDPAEPGMEGSATPYLRAIRQLQLRWIVTADQVIRRPRS